MRIYAVVVAYHPDMAELSRLCSALAAQDAQVVVVDNTPDGARGATVPAGCTILPMGRNTGIAHAQNVGIRHALAAGADAVALFDQDSRVEPQLLARLGASLRAGVAGVAGPRIVDEASGHELPATRLSPSGLPRPVFAGHAVDPVPVDVIIASGTIATRPVFELAGTMDESLFIDSVDTEWCLRCRARKIPMHVVPRRRTDARCGQMLLSVAEQPVAVQEGTRALSFCP